VFFSDPAEGVRHVALYIGDRQIIHAPNAATSYASPTSPTKPAMPAQPAPHKPRTL